MSLRSCSGWLNVSFPLSTQNREEELKIQKYGNHLFVKSLRHKLDTCNGKNTQQRGSLTKKNPPSDGGHACDGGLAEETFVLLELAVPLVRPYVRLRRSQVTVPAADNVPMYKISLHPNHHRCLFDTFHRISYPYW